MKPRKLHQRITQAGFALLREEIIVAKDALQRRLNNGVTVTTIAHEFKVPDGTMKNLLDSAGLVRRVHVRTPKRRLNFPVAAAPPANGTHPEAFDPSPRLTAIMIVLRRLAIDLNITSDELLPFLPAASQRTLPFPPK